MSYEYPDYIERPTLWYRASSCSYCHLHDGDHDDSMAPDRDLEVRQWICTGCHSPHYGREQFANGKRQLEIADLKLKA